MTKKVEKLPESYGQITAMKSMTHSLLMKDKNAVHFYRFGTFETIDSCKMLADIVDFTFEPTNMGYLYVLNSANEIMLFEVSQARRNCKPIGKVSLTKKGTSVAIWGTSLLTITNSDGTMTILEMAGDANEFIAREGNLHSA